MRDDPLAGCFLSVAEQIGVGGTLMVADLGAAQAGEAAFRFVRASALRG